MYKLFKKSLLILLILIYSSFNSLLYAQALSPSRDYLQSYYAFKTGNMDYAIIRLGKLINSKVANKEIYERLISAYLIKDNFVDAYNVAISIPNFQTNKVASFIKLINDLRNGDFKPQNIKDKVSNSVLDQVSLNLLKGWAFYAEGKSQEAQNVIKNIPNLQTEEMKQFLKDFKVKAFIDILIYYNLALLNYNSNPDEAITYFQKALNSYENSFTNLLLYDRIIINYVKLLQTQKQTKQAQNVLDMAAKTHEKDIIIPIILERLQKKQAILDNTFNIKKNKINLAKNAASEVLSNVATLLANFNGMQAAWFYDRMALEINAANTGALWHYASIVGNRNIDEEKDTALAINILNKINASSVYFFSAKIQQALLYAERENYEDAISLLHNLRKIYNKDNNKLDTINYFLSNVYIKKNDYKNAALLLNSYLDKVKDSSNWALYYQAGIVNHHLHNTKKAIENFEIALQKTPNNADLLNYYGYILLENSNSHKQALELLQKAASIEPTNGYILDLLGWAYYCKKDYEKSIQCLQLAVKLLPFESEIIEHLGDAYWKAKKKIQARYEWQNAINVSKNIKQIEKIKAKITNE